MHVREVLCAFERFLDQLVFEKRRRELAFRCLHKWSVASILLVLSEIRRGDLFRFLMCTVWWCSVLPHQQLHSYSGLLVAKQLLFFFFNLKTSISVPFLKSRKFSRSGMRFFLFFSHNGSTLSCYQISLLSSSCVLLSKESNC